MKKLLDWVRGRSQATPPVRPPSAAPGEYAKWDAPTLRFLCEQDGDPERLLKQALRALLETCPAIARAYLARVDYGDPASYEVALCLVGPTDEALVKQASLIFAQHAGKGPHLDILFLSAAQEAELRRVCGPFHDAG